MSESLADPGAPAVVYCANHPDVETLLRCNRCDKPICLKCAVLTDVGYRCKECIRGVQSSYFNAIPTDNLIGLGVALVLPPLLRPSLVLSLPLSPASSASSSPFAIGGGAGGALAQIIRTSVGKRRGRYLRHFTLAGIVLGVLLGSLVASVLWNTRFSTSQHLRLRFSPQ